MEEPPFEHNEISSAKVEDKKSKPIKGDIDDLGKLLAFYVDGWPNEFSDSHSKYAYEVQSFVNSLLERDYNISVIENEKGEICKTYPLNIVVQESEKGNSQEANRQTNDLDKLTSYFKESRFCRVHGRFVVPVILLGKKYICRSATISVLGESLLNRLHASSRDIYNKGIPSYILSYFSESQRSSNDKDVNENTSEYLENVSSNSNPSMFSMNSLRALDVQLLKLLNVKYIADLMVENRKKKLGLTVTTSEKVETHTYANFFVNSLPFPGCEFFCRYKDNEHCGHGLNFDWNQHWVDAELSIETHEHDNYFKWKNYKNWDVIVLTQNYMKLLLHIFGCTDSNDGLLVHCISGWDRTPLFVSLLRLSLWADEKIHKSLNSEEILYLTLAYDWMLFGHQLYNRLYKGEDIFHFCFYFLQFLTGDEFSYDKLSNCDILASFNNPSDFEGKHKSENLSKPIPISKKTSNEDKEKSDFFISPGTSADSQIHDWHFISDKDVKLGSSFESNKSTEEDCVKNEHEPHVHEPLKHNLTESLENLNLNSVGLEAKEGNDLHHNKNVQDQEVAVSDQVGDHPKRKDDLKTSGPVKQRSGSFFVSLDGNVMSNIISENYLNMIEEPEINVRKVFDGEDEVKIKKEIYDNSEELDFDDVYGAEGGNVDELPFLLGKEVDLEGGKKELLENKGNIEDLEFKNNSEKTNDTLQNESLTNRRQKLMEVFNLFNVTYSNSEAINSKISRWFSNSQNGKILSSQTPEPLRNETQHNDKGLNKNRQSPSLSLPGTGKDFVSKSGRKNNVAKQQYENEGTGHESISNSSSHNESKGIRSSSNTFFFGLLS